MRAQALHRTRRNFRKVVCRVGRAPETMMSLAPMLHEAEDVVGTAGSKSRLEPERVKRAPSGPVLENFEPACGSVPVMGKGSSSIRAP